MSRIIEICNLIDKADSAYYRVGHQQIMSDADYDALKVELKSLDPSNERLTRVGCIFDESELRIKVRHNIPMGSLDNTEDGIAGYADWYSDMSAKIGSEPKIMASLKIDGGSICATYKDGNLVRVATRGNGDAGDDITVNAVNFKYLPTVLSEKIDVDVRGEAILYKSDFESICERDGIADEDKSNPRNVGNGIIGRDDGTDSNYIRFIAFNIEGVNLTSEAEKLKYIKTLGFMPVPHSICNKPSDLTKFYNQVVIAREDLPFEIDGVVVVLDDVSSQRLFITKDPKSRLRPKYARAVKFPHKSNVTTIVDVIESVGHTRAIVPTAVLEEVRVGGVNVKHALLNNYDEIKRLGLAIGDKVEVVLAGDVIPKIIRKVSESDKRISIDEPKHCPACGESTSREYRGKKGAVTYCSNEECHAARLCKISHFIGTSKTGVGILGIGDTILKALWDLEILNDPADLYTLTVEQIKDIKLEGDVRIGELRAKQIVKNIQDKKVLPLDTFLGSLGIDLLGRRRVKLLNDASNGKLHDLDSWRNVKMLETLQVASLGYAIRESIVAGIIENAALIDKMLKVGVVVTPLASVSSDSTVSIKTFNGLKFCLTGTRMYIKEIESLGGIIKSGVSKDLDFLVQADPLSVSSKTKKAEEYGVRVISVDYLKQAIDGKVTLNKNDYSDQS